MIPLRLHLKNFLSYGESVDPLDFTAFKLACLTGKNGHGKSALLDAITWAVWGEARKADFSRTPDSDLLRLNADEMTVEFIFDLNGYEYTVQRGFKRGKKQGKSTLEFSVRENQDTPSRLLTGSSKRETQARIIETVGLDYRTFINSSFLKQGKSDEFTRQSPKDRKDILTNILGLTYYDQLLEETKLQLNAKKAEEQASLQRIGSIEEELKEEETARRQEKELKDSLAKQDQSLTQILEQENKILEKLNHLRVEKEKVESWKREEQSLLTRKQEYETRINSYARELDDMQQFIHRKNNIETNFKRYEEINQTLKTFLETEAKCKELEDQKKQIEIKINEKQNELREKLAGLHSEEKQVFSVLQENQQWVDKEDKINLQYQKYQQLVALENQYSESRPDYDNLLLSIQQTETQIEQEKQKLLNRISELKGQTRQLPQKQKELKALQEKLQGVTALEKQRDQLQKKMHEVEEKGLSARNRIGQCEDKTKQLENTLKETKDITELIDKGSKEDCPVCKQPLSEHAQQDLQQHYQQEIKKLLTEIKTQQQQGEQAKEEREKLGMQYKSLRVEIDDVQKRYLGYQNEQENLPHKQQEIEQLDQYQQEMNTLEKQIQKQQYADNAHKQLEAHRQSLKNLKYDPNQHTTLQKQLHEQRQAEADWNTLQEKKNQLTELNERISTIKKEFEEKQEILNQQTFCKEERKVINSLDEKIKPLQEKLDQRKVLFEEQTKLRNAPAENQQLLQAIERKPVIENDRQETQQRIQDITNELVTIQKQLQESSSLLEQFEEQNNTYQKTIAERKVIEQERNRIYQDIGSVETRLEVLQKKKAETESLRDSMQDNAREIRYLEILRKAFSRDGIPAMMVEQALPELEEDANRLLRRLTHGSCTVRFQTQRESKTGGVKETLDIMISDEMGTRDYDMFSGGEAFRTDLAVRIALSQLLCRRAGSRLQLLVIDEGFGTQDSEGLSNIVDAIDEIQDEFEKVLIVTHIEEMKERFKDRIEVVKDPGIGSRFQVVHAM